MCGKDELFVISEQRLPSGEDIHIDNETVATERSEHITVSAGGSALYTLN